MKTTLMTQFNVINRIVARNLADVTAEQSLRDPQPAGNNINWVLGHLICIYNVMLPALDQEPVWTEETAAEYARGAKHLAPEDARPLADLLRDWETVTGRFLAGLGDLTEDRYGDPAPFSPGKDPDETLGSLLTVLVFHQAYHCGQLGLLRRMAGLETAIK